LRFVQPCPKLIVSLCKAIPAVCWRNKKSSSACC